VHTEKTSRSGCLPPYPAEYVLVVHQGFLPEAAGHVQKVELRGFR